MKPKLSCLIALVCILFASCKKEGSVENGGNNPNPPGGTGDLLSKIATTEGGESSSTEFEYDVSNRLTREKITGMSQGMNIGNDLIIRRNPSGIITSTVQKNAEAAQQGVDSVVTRVLYDAASNRYIGRVMEISLFGFSTTDSTIFFYDGSGRIIKEDSYIYSESLGIPPELSSRIEYMLGGDGSINELYLSAADATSGAMELMAAVKFTYDGKVSPLILSSGEAAAIGRTDYVAKQNGTKIEYNDIGNGGASSLTLNATYTYNSKNKPLTANTTQLPGNLTGTRTFTYK